MRDFSTAHFDRVRLYLPFLCRRLNQELAHRGRRLPYRRHGARRGPATGRGTIIGACSGIAEYHLNLTERHPQFLGRCQRQFAPRALPSVHFTREHADHAVVAKMKPGREYCRLSPKKPAAATPPAATTVLRKSRRPKGRYQHARSQCLYKSAAIERET